MVKSIIQFYCLLWPHYQVLCISSKSMYKIFVCVRRECTILIFIARRYHSLMLVTTHRPTRRWTTFHLDLTLCRAPTNTVIGVLWQSTCGGGRLWRCSSRKHRLWTVNYGLMWLQIYKLYIFYIPHQYGCIKYQLF